MSGFIVSWAEGQSSKDCSEWGFICLVTCLSSVPQGSIPEPVLFSISIKDVDVEAECTISKFADDTKLGVIDSLEGQDVLWRDLDSLWYWAMINGMKFNMSECHILYLGWGGWRAACRKGSGGAGQQQ
ncbi:hypothetical protein BTVI_80473 [Pitangus sulphuratus]|nr:hypothetical protein BTVI_80473 [Pitangus sulphuratus]